MDTVERGAIAGEKTEERRRIDGDDGDIEKTADGGGAEGKSVTGT